VRLPEKPIIKSKSATAQRYQRMLDHLTERAAPDDWAAVRALRIKESDNYATVVMDYRQRLLLAAPVAGRAQAASGFRIASISAKVRPSPSSVAIAPAKSCHRFTMTSAYTGESSNPKHKRPDCSAAIIVVPLPKKPSSTICPAVVLLPIARLASNTGFCVGW
jgi:hypothetical protein